MRWEWRDAALSHDTYPPVRFTRQGRSARVEPGVAQLGQCATAGQSVANGRVAAVVECEFGNPPSPSTLPAVLSRRRMACR